MSALQRASTALVCLLVSAGLTAAQPATSPPVDLAHVSLLPFSGVALGINDRGDLVGHSNFRAFLWTEDWGYVDLGTLPNRPLCEAAAVNNRREVVGRCWGGGVLETRAFFWTPEEGMLDIGRGMATAINDLGEVAGGGEATDELQESWRWVGGRRQLLGVSGWQSMAMGINEWGHITGSGPSPDSLRIFVWRDDEGLEDLGAWGIPFDINDVDEISANAALTWNPSLLRPGQVPVDIQMPPGKYGAARGVNNMSVVVGTATDNESEELFAFMWTAADDYTEIGAAGTTAEKINQVGEIAGSVRGEDGLRYPAVWRLRTGIGVRLDAAAAALRAHIGRGVVKAGPATSVLKRMDRTARAAQAGADPSALRRTLRSLRSQVRALLRARQLPEIDAWLLRTIEFAVADLDTAR